MRTVLIELDKPRQLRLEANAIADAEEKLGMGFGKIMKAELSIALVRVMLWAGLKWQDRALTLEKVGNLINNFLRNGGDIEYLGQKISEAIIASGLFKVDEDSPNLETEIEEV